MKTIYIYWRLDDEVKKNFLSQLTNEAVEPPNHKTHMKKFLNKSSTEDTCLDCVNILGPFDFSV